MDKIITKIMDTYRELIETSKPCLAKNYLPYPPRLWNRTISPCYEFIEAVDVFVPYLKRTIPTKELGNVISMFRKGNVLQYSANSSTNTKNQTYSRIVKGHGKRKKAWSTQTVSFTHPNINKLERNNSTIVANNPGGRLFFPECSKNPKPQNFFPTTPGSSNPINYPNVPDGAPNEPTNGPIAYPIIPVPEPKLDPSIIEGGNLVSCTQEDICSGAILSTLLEDFTCNPTSDSDVPGPIMELCYPKNIPVTIPRQRTTYVSNATKWPVNGITSIPAYNSDLPLSDTPSIKNFFSDINSFSNPSIQTPPTPSPTPTPQ